MKMLKLIRNEGYTSSISQLLLLIIYKGFISSFNQKLSLFHINKINYKNSINTL